MPLRARLILVAAASTLALVAFPASASAQLGLPCGLLTPCPPPPQPPQEPVPVPSGGQQWRLTIEASDDRVVDRDAVTFTGALTSDGGTSLANHPIELVAVRWPYRTQEAVAFGRTDSVGRYSLWNKPDLNTRYFVRAYVGPSGATPIVSPVRNVLMLAELNRFKVDVPRDFVVKMVLKVDFPNAYSFRLGKRPVHWYIIRAGTRKLIRLGITRTKARRGNKLVARIQRRIPRRGGNYRFRGTFCIELNKVRDDGVGPPGKGRCP